MAYDPAIGKMVLFGGALDGSATSLLDDTWTWDGSTWTEQHPAVSPPARGGASMVYDPALGKVVLFGGLGSDFGLLNDTWTYNGTIWTQIVGGISPSGRFQPSMAYDTSSNKIVLFGGADTSDPQATDTWTFDGTWNVQATTTSPAARGNASMAYDAANGQIVLFGGVQNGGPTGFDDTWSFNGTNWSKDSPAVSPGGRYGAAVTYDPVLGQVVLFGGSQLVGNSVGQFSDTWTYNGSTWASQSTVTSPPPDEAVPMAYDNASGQLILVTGGSATDAPLSETWAFGSISTGSASPTVTSIVAPTPTSSAYGNAIPVSVKVSSTAGIPANGDKVTVSAIPAGSSTPSGSCAISLVKGSTSATGTCALPVLNAGGYVISAVFQGADKSGGDSRFASSTGSSLLTVTKAATRLVAQPISVVASLLQIGFTFSATLTSQATAGPAVGQTIFFSGAGGSATCAAVTNAAGVATCNVSIFSILGFALSTTYSASYLGSANYQPSAATGSVSLV